MNIKKFHLKIHNLDQLLLMILQHSEISLQIFVSNYLLTVLLVLKLQYLNYQLTDKTLLGNNSFQNQAINQLTLNNFQHK